MVTNLQLGKIYGLFFYFINMSEQTGPEPDPKSQTLNVSSFILQVFTWNKTDC